MHTDCVQSLVLMDKQNTEGINYFENVLLVLCFCG